MLRTARSLPTLRVLNSTIKAELKQESASFSSKYNLVKPYIPHNEPQFVPRRFVHQTSKANSTTLLNSKRSEFSVMSLNSLKQECRKRGLKVSGRKAELVSRITNHETSFSSSTLNSHQLSTLSRPTTSPSSALKTSKIMMNFSNSVQQQAKGDTSHIDFIKPVDIEPPKLVQDDYIIKIPSISTEASAKTVTKLEHELAKETTTQTIVSKADGSDIKIFEQGSIEHIEEQNITAETVQFDEVVKSGESESEPIDETYEFDHSEIPSRDKTFWGSALAVIGGLIAIKSYKKDKK